MQVAQNKKAYFDYQISDELEVGLVLLGVEIKAIRSGRVNITGSYIKPMNSGKVSELYWVGSNFHTNGADDTRTKKILLHKAERERLIGKLSAGEFTILPLELYLKNGRAKLRIGLGKHKKKFDKREIIKEREIDRRINRRLRGKD